MKAIFIITGNIDGGKTLFMKDLSEFLSLFESRIKGFYSKGIFSPEGKKEFALVNLSDKSEIHLSSRNQTEGYLPAGKFYFNPLALKTGNEIINNALQDDTRILIIDEIGPIELNGKIWHQGLVRVLDQFQGILVVSIRKKLIEPALEIFRIHEAFIEDIDRTTPRKTGEAILSLMNKKPGSV